MYLQITTRCNMNCIHCGFSCTAVGQDMSEQTWKNAINFVENTGEIITIGGGEPTLHPQLWGIIGYAMATNYTDTWMATNGKNTNTALKLAALAYKFRESSPGFQCVLSLDPWHEEIEQQVVDTFVEYKAVHNVSQNVLSQGRAKQYRNEIENSYDIHRNQMAQFIENDSCICSEMLIDPAGYIHGCGCPDAPIFGNVNEATNIHIPEEWEYGECSFSQPHLTKDKE